MANLESTGIRFSETMSGWLGAGEKDPRQGEVAGRSSAAAIRFDVWIHIQSLDRFLRDPTHAAQLTGTVLYTISAQMDESHFEHKSKAIHVRLLRKLTRPMRDTFFIRTNRDPTAANRFVTWLLYRLGY
jgi:hypothetical protein